MSTNSKEKQREYSRRYRMRHPEATVPEQARIYKQHFIDDHRARGLCIECNNPVEKGQSRCSQCLGRRRLRSVQRMRDGKCIDCSNKAIERHRYCQNCYLKDIARRHLGTRKRWRELLELFEKQNGICALSGLSLTLGSNTDLDHIVPRSRGGSNDLSNLQWVLESINHMKNTMLEDEFFILVETVYLHMQKRAMKNS